MQIKQPIKLITFCFFAFSFITSCKSIPTNKKNIEQKENETKTVQQQQIEQGEIPIFEYSGDGTKIECEDTKLIGALIQEEHSASKEKYVLLENSSVALEFKITLPEGKYECLVCTKSFDNKYSKFYINIDNKSKQVAPSNPPLGMWELTSRTPFILDVTESKTVYVKLQSKNIQKSEKAKLYVDYIQFVKL